MKQADANSPAMTPVALEEPGPIKHLKGETQMKNLNAIVLVFVMAMAAQANAQSSTAKELFAGKCAMCHGADGSASTGIGKSLKIPSFHSSDFQSQPDADLKTAISKGKGKMPGFAGKLTDAQIDQMVTYIHALGKK